MKQKFLLGLDIGTNSVGWSLTDEEYNVVKKGGKSLWGIRLFDEANPASERRGFRCARRRLARRKERIRMLQELFAPEIEKVDPGFFQRLALSKYHREDRASQFDSVQTLFVDSDYNDKNYFHDYKTIYHLRKELLNCDDKKDIRLVYLALHHIIKYRGNFLHAGESFEPMNLQSISESFDNINKTLGAMGKTKFVLSDEIIKNIADKAEVNASISSMKEKLKPLLEGVKYVDDSDKTYLNLIICLISGSKVKVKDLFEIEDEDVASDFGTISFKDSEIDDNLETILEKIGDEHHNKIIMEAKKLHDMFTLGRLLKGCSTISDAMVGIYNTHKEELKKFKIYIKENHPDLKNRFFKEVPGKKEKLANYVSYVGLNKGGNKVQRFAKANKEDFYKFIRKELKINSKETYSDPYLNEINEKMTSGKFLPKQNSTDNGVFPVQMNLKELREIILRQKKYYPFLSEMDEDGNSVAAKIEKLLLFKIPYYVGPLAYNKNNPSFSWCVRNEGEEKTKITPWNFDKVINKEKSGELFIKRMLNHCTYLPNEFCLPKNSLVYSIYCLLEELNKININGTSISYENKSDLIKNYFLMKKVKKSDLLNFFKNKYGLDCVVSYRSEKEIEEIRTDLSSFRTFIGIFGLEYCLNNMTKIDNIINDITLFEDKAILETRLRNEYELDDEKVKKIKGLAYKGYGSLSRELLVDLKTTIDTDTGDKIETSILKIMMDTNETLMEILNNSKYKFKKLIEEKNNVETDEVITPEDYVANLYVSPGMKRPLIQAYKIIEEVKKIIAPNTIDEYYIQCTRSNKEKKDRKESRLDRLLKLYGKVSEICKKEAEKDIEEWGGVKRFAENNKTKLKNSDGLQLRSDKLYLYYLQMGRCMYSGKPISISELKDNSKCDIEHIIPQSLVKDDSIQNTVLVLKEYNQRKKDFFPIPEDILFPGHKKFYEFLKSSQLMGEKKYHNLLRRDPLSDAEVESFVNRQLVYTNQSVKALVQLLRKYESIDESKIVYSKAENVSDFRKEFDLVKCRDVNNLHHAHDAYLNVVVGSTLRGYYGLISPSRISEMRKNKQTLNIKKIFEKDRVVKSQERVYWNGEETIKRVEQQIYNRHDILVSVRQYIGNSLFRKVSMLPSSDNLYPLKNPTNSADIANALSNTEKYGGYNDLANGYYCLVSSKDKKGKRKVTIEAMQNVIVPFGSSEEKTLAYLRDNKKLIDPIILHNPLRINLIIENNKSRYCITGKTGDQLTAKNLKESFYSKEYMTIMKKIEKYNKLLLSSRKKERDAFPEKDGKIIISPAKNDQTKEISLCNSELDKVAQEYFTKIDQNIFENISPVKLLRKKNNEGALINVFAEKDIYDKIKIMSELQKVLQCNVSTSDLELLKLAKNFGKFQVTARAEGVKIINQSVTGFYEKVIYDGTLE